MYMIFDRLETLCADHVLDAAGILGCCMWVNPKGYKPGGEKFMAFIDHLCDGKTGVCKCDVSFFGYKNMVFFPQILHCDADTGFLKIQFVCHVYGTDNREFFAQG